MQPKKKKKKFTNLFTYFNFRVKILTYCAQLKKLDCAPWSSCGTRQSTNAFNSFPYLFLVDCWQITNSLVVIIPFAFKHLNPEMYSCVFRNKHKHSATFIWFGGKTQGPIPNFYIFCNLETRLYFTPHFGSNWLFLLQQFCSYTDTCRTIP